jgi:hypothetical protein
MPKLCSTPNCNTPVFSQGFCMYHYRIHHVSKKSLTQTDNEPAKPFPAPYRTKQIKKVSDSQLLKLARYRKARDEHFEKYPKCQYPGCDSTDVTLHHAAGKIGELLYNKKYFRSLCLPHHRWAELHPKEAKKLKLSVTRLDK